MLILSLDCSFKRTGIAFLDTTARSLELTTVSATKLVKNFQGIMEATEEILKGLDPFLERADKFVMEQPIPSSMFSAGLFALDSAVYLRKKPDAMYHPTVLGSIHGMRNYSKSQSVELAKSLIKALGTTTNKSRFTHDEAEALIYLCTFLVSSQVIRESLAKKLLLVAPKLDRR